MAESSDDPPPGGRVARKTRKRVVTDDDQGLGFGLLFFEKFLLAIIDGHKVGTGQTRRERLNAAMQALVGKKLSRNPVPGDLDGRDDEALLWMGGEYGDDRTLFDWKPGTSAVNKRPRARSDRRLALDAARLFFPQLDANGQRVTACAKSSAVRIRRRKRRELAALIRPILEQLTFTAPYATTTSWSRLKRKGYDDSRTNSRNGTFQCVWRVTLIHRSCERISR
jgi:hypothetical protein